MMHFVQYTGSGLSHPTHSHEKDFPFHDTLGYRFSFAVPTY